MGIEDKKLDEVIIDAIGLIVKATRNKVDHSVNTHFEKTKKKWPWEAEVIPQEFKITTIEINIIEKIEKP